MLRRRTAVASLVALAAGSRVVPLPAQAAPDRGAPPPRWLVREVGAFLSVRDPETGERRDAELAIAGYDDGSWWIEANPDDEADDCDGFLHLPAHRSADAALTGLLGMVFELPAPEPSRRAEPAPAPEVRVGPVLEGVGLLTLGGAGGCATHHVKFGQIGAAKINGEWALVAGSELRTWLEETFGDEAPAPTLAPVPATFAAD